MTLGATAPFARLACYTVLERFCFRWRASPFGRATPKPLCSAEEGRKCQARSCTSEYQHQRLKYKYDQAAPHKHRMHLSPRAEIMDDGNDHEEIREGED
jgi:hypothetical protein